MRRPTDEEFADARREQEESRRQRAVGFRRAMQRWGDEWPPDAEPEEEEEDDDE